jgi:hypothetical protein
LIVTWTSGIEHTIDLGGIIGRFVAFEPLRTTMRHSKPSRMGGNDGGYAQRA